MWGNLVFKDPVALFGPLRVLLGAFIELKQITSGTTGNSWAELKSDNVIVFSSLVPPVEVFWANFYITVRPLSLFSGLLPEN